MPSITSPGIGSGLDIESLVTELVAFEGQPTIDRLNLREAEFQAELSGLGTFRATLDSFRSTLEPLMDLSGFGTRTASSSDEELFTVSADSTVAPGDYDIEVVSLAQSNKLSSGAFVSPESLLGTGTLTIELDPTAEDGGLMTLDFDVLADASLANIRDAINEADDNPGVVASIINAEDGAHLVLTSTKTGKDKDIIVKASGGDGGLEALVYDPAGGTTNLTETQAATDAEIRIDSFTHFSSTNSVTTLIDGLTITLEGADPGTTATLSVGLDLDQARGLVDDFVDGYNSLIKTAGELTSYDPETLVTGLLQGDSIVPSLTDRLYSEFNETISGGTFSSLRDLGMSINVDGEIELDDDVLTEALSNNFNEVGKLFADEIDGVAVRMDALLDTYLKADGLLDVREEGLEASIEDIDDEREQLDTHLIAVEERYRSQFLALDQLIAELNSTSNFLTTQLAALPSPGALVGGS